MESNQIYCGAGRADITPPQELLLRLPGLMGGRFSGKVYDELFARAIAFKSSGTMVLLVSFDLDKAPDPEGNLTLLQERFGLSRDQILLFGIHTHTAPICSVRPFEGMNSRENKTPGQQEAMLAYEALVRERLLEAAEAAVDSLQPAKIGWAAGKSYINVNRCQSFYVERKDGTVQTCCALGANPEGPVDRTLFVLKAETLEGEPIAFFVNYPVHCCVMICNDSDGHGGFGVSGDIGGVTSQLMEEKYGGVAIWSSGAAGDVNPIAMNQYYYPDPRSGAFCEHKVEGAGAAVAALRVLTGRHFADITEVIRRIKCGTTQAAVSAASGWSRTPGRRVVKHGKGPDAPVEVFTGEGIEPYAVCLHPVVIGDVALCGVSGELYTTLGWAVQKASPAAHTCIINHDACLSANSGYILDDDTIARCEHNLSGHFIPGAKESAILPGHVAASLAALTKDLFEKMD